MLGGGDLRVEAKTGEEGYRRMWGRWWRTAVGEKEALSAEGAQVAGGGGRTGLIRLKRIYNF
jgi:hypothetical protein